MDAATRAGSTLELTVRMGDFIAGGAALLRVHAGDPADLPDVARLVTLYDERTHDLEIAFLADRRASAEDMQHEALSIRTSIGARDRAVLPRRLANPKEDADGLIQVFDVWESQESFEAFGQTLLPIMGELGADPGQPQVAPVHNIIQG